MKKILIIEDEESIRMALEDDFLQEGYEVNTASEGIDGLDKAENKELDMIILDIMLPGMSGFEICKKLRSKNIQTPIIMLTAKGQEIDRVVGLEIGADDYVTKPFSPRELQAWVKSIFRRVDASLEMDIKDMFFYKGLKVDFRQYECYKDDEKISLTLHEFELLKYLVRNRGRVIDRDELLDEVWGRDVVVSPRTVDTHMANLRKKIEEEADNPQLIISVRGIGYKIPPM
jgi:DNA-binding response OmpR family regulator